jgi:alginate O-acetyltransferase complex protein AlgI
VLDFLKSLMYNPHYPLIFNSVLFVVLFTLFYAVYFWVFKNIKARNILLLIFSLFFYYKISGLFIILLIVVATSDFLIGKAMVKAKDDRSKKWFLWLSVIIDVGILLTFKYTNFLLNSIFGIFDEPPPLLLDLVMPLGISFFIFKTLSYTFDLYREVIEKPEKSYWNYLLYVSFFPNILAGPISKARDLLPQFASQREITREFIGKGFFLILVGAFKKVFIADMLAMNFVDRIFDSPEFFSGFEGLMATYGYTMQIYFDFSGYTDIVIGIAFLLGIEVAPNFNKPFLAQNVTDFWRRWHMTLSAWLNEYVFYPLSYYFRRWKMWGALMAVMLTFFISGLWHGPAWTYILWGLSHGLAIAWGVVTQNIRSKIAKKSIPWLYKFISIFITFHFLAFSMVLFRSADLESAWKVYTLIFTKLDFSVASQWVVLYWKPFSILLLALVLHYLPMKWYTWTMSQFVRMNWMLKAVVVFAGILLIYQAFSSDAQPFIYLEF